VPAVFCCCAPPKTGVSCKGKWGSLFAGKNALVLAGDLQRYAASGDAEFLLAQKGAAADARASCGIVGSQPPWVAANLAGSQPQAGYVPRFEMRKS
jgi:hypothetical protein